MAYRSRNGRRPGEYASKSAHVHLINSPSVQAFLAECNLPKRADEITLPTANLIEHQLPAENTISHVIAVDGGYREIVVHQAFPSATIAFFQFGILVFSVEDLENLEDQPFIDPEEMSKLKKLQRRELTLPIRNVSLKDTTTLTNSIRQTLYNFFRDMDDGLVTLRWFIFEEFNEGIAEYQLANCPHCPRRNVSLIRNQIATDFSFQCPNCGKKILITDVFRLHEAIDDDLGASGILGYITTTIEQILLVHMIRLILNIKPTLLHELLFIKDGPLAFFGQTANMHRPMRQLVRHLYHEHDLYLVGLEKSGAFVEHANEISDKLEPGNILILDNEYIYRYILPGQADPAAPYGRTTYYSNKLIFKSIDERIYVVTLPTREILVCPIETDFSNFHVILANIQKLRCDMYDDALFPVALVNKLVSLSDHPSSRILQRFAVGSLNDTS